VTPSASSASARCTVVSCRIRRAHQPEVRPGPQVHTGVTGPAERSAASSGVAPDVSHCAHPSADAQDDSVSGNGGRESARETMIEVAHRWMVPACLARSATVQSGHVGTDAKRSGASATASANAAISAPAASQNHE